MSTILDTLDQKREYLLVYNEAAEPAAGSQRHGSVAADPATSDRSESRCGLRARRNPGATPGSFVCGGPSSWPMTGFTILQPLPDNIDRLNAQIAAPPRGSKPPPAIRNCNGIAVIIDPEAA